MCCRGFLTLEEAAADALAAIEACRAPARTAAPRLRISRSDGIRHSPDRDGWRAAMTSVHEALSGSGLKGEVRDGSAS